MKVYLALIFTLTFQLSKAQTTSFSTDTTRISKYYKDGSYLPRIQENYWIIEGKEIQFGDPTITVNSSPQKLDTIYFKGYRKKNYDTLVCNFESGKHYEFFYNSCCGAFNVHDKENHKMIEGSVNFKTLNHISIQDYIGTFGEAGIQINFSDTITKQCRSAMSPNIYSIEILMTDSCTTDSLCKSLCFPPNETNPIYNYHNYQIKEKLINFLYLPLNSKPLVVGLDPKTHQIQINDHIIKR